MKTLRNSLIAAALVAVAATAAHAAKADGSIELHAGQGYGFALGPQTASIHYRQRDGFKEIVTLVGPNRHATPGVRQSAPLAPGETRELALSDCGWPVLTLTDHPDRVSVAIDYHRQLNPTATPRLSDAIQ